MWPAPSIYRYKMGCGQLEVMTDQKWDVASSKYLQIQNGMWPARSIDRSEMGCGQLEVFTDKKWDVASSKY
ncbi:hypothetical protein Bpfe_000815 [Biomphalaria pfeifferi]|uniref:Uncharacterized protein n=1 Tax=Biomphalaria pfeifferi TaxID=112525 RepID=A0AAD8CC64_BIOPF|nr:hypothetical protein Bpfe_000815 [Biomphalaria pfeifferi]